MEEFLKFDIIKTDMGSTGGKKMFKKLVEKNRSIRIFDESVELSQEDFLELVDLARLSPAGRNQLSFRFYLVKGEDLKKIYSMLHWAGAIPEWKGPKPGERPGSVILVITDENTLSPLNAINMGIGIQSMMLGACEKGFGGCIIRAIDHTEIKKVLNFKRGVVQLALAIGKPVQKVFLEPWEGTASYWMDEEKNNHVPKHPIEDYLSEEE